MVVKDLLLAIEQVETDFHRYNARLDGYIVDEKMADECAYIGNELEDALWSVLRFLCPKGSL